MNLAYPNFNFNTYTIRNFTQILIPHCSLFIVGVLLSFKDLMQIILVDAMVGRAMSPLLANSGDRAVSPLLANSGDAITSPCGFLSFTVEGDNNGVHGAWDCPWEIDLVVS